VHDATHDSPHGAHGGGHHAGSGMSGMVLGVTVKGRVPGAVDITGALASSAAPRRLALHMIKAPAVNGDRDQLGFALADGAQAPERPTVPGPLLVLRRGEPVEIDLVNRLGEATAIHWHGMELDSYYDGVHGWSGIGRRVTPLIEPGTTFTVKFTPPRAGTFIYHTHLHDSGQLTSGMYGALVVLEPGETFDPELDHVLVIGRSGQERDAPTVLDGSTRPQFVWKAGARHRVRFVNITPGDVHVASIVKGDSPVEWRPLTKDGAPVPPGASAPKPATQAIAVGETYDFEYQAPAGRQSMWVNVRTPGGRWAVQGHIVVK
jgi:FtsP/CotA-like multicopper oxidase with cupredoxin domain